MADPIPSEIAAADAAAEAAAKSGSYRPNSDVDAAREAELDSAFADAQKLAPPAADEANFGRDNNGVKLVTEGAPSDAEVAVEKAAADAVSQQAAEIAAAEAAKVAEAAAKAETTPAKPKGLLDDLLADSSAKAAPETPPADPYGDVKLRSDASPKTRETFEQLKTVAKQREEAANLRASEIQTKHDELAAKVAELEKRTVAPEVQEELKELRQFRAQFDTANDPEFRQKFDSRINTNYAAIYAKLQAHGLPQAEVEKLKSFSQSERDNAIDGFLAKLPPVDRKFIEAKTLDNINVADERERALQEARGKADQILAAKKSEPAQATAQRDAAVAGILRPVLEKLPWLHAQNVPPNSAPEDRKRIEDSNKIALSMQESLKRAIVDDSPATRAEAALAVPLAHHFKSRAEAAEARADGLQKKLDAITNASATSRAARSIAPSKPTVTAPASDASAGEAIDDLFSQIQNGGR